jgi:hypothetical protein
MIMHCRPFFARFGRGWRGLVGLDKGRWVAALLFEFGNTQLCQSKLLLPLCHQGTQFGVFGNRLCVVNSYLSARSGVQVGDLRSLRSLAGVSHRRRSAHLLHSIVPLP